MRVLVCGSRHFNDRELLEKTLDEIPITTIIQGEARGADTLAREYAERRGLDVISFPALWDTHGKAAGPIRNARMLSEGQPELVVAFLFPVGVQEVCYGLSDSQYNRGTKNMIKLATEAGIPVKVIEI